MRGVLALIGGAAGAQAVAVFASPLLTRLYTPEDFGLLAVFVALLGVLSVVSSARYEVAVPIPKTDTAAFSILLVGIFVNAGFGAMLLLAVCLFRVPIAAIFELPVLADYLWMMPAAVLLVGLYRSLYFWAIRDKSFGSVARTRLTQATLGVATQLGLGAFHVGPVGLVVGNILSQTAGVLTLARLLRGRLGVFIHRTSRKRCFAMALRHNRFPKFDLPAAGLNALGANLPQMLLAVLFYPAVAGYYILAYRVISLPVSIVGQAVGQALYGHAAEALRAGQLDRLVRRTAMLLLLLISGPLIFIFLYGELLFSWIFGQQWATAGVYASWLMLGASIQFVYSPLSLMLLATAGQHLNLAIQLVLFGVRSLAIMLGYFFGDPQKAVMAIAFADAVGYSLGLVLILRRVRQAASQGEVRLPERLRPLDDRAKRTVEGTDSV